MTLYIKFCNYRQDLLRNRQKNMKKTLREDLKNGSVLLNTECLFLKFI